MPAATVKSFGNQKGSDLSLPMMVGYTSSSTSPRFGAVARSIRAPKLPVISARTAEPESLTRKTSASPNSAYKASERLQVGAPNPPLSLVDESLPSLAERQVAPSLRISNDLRGLVIVSYDWSGVRTRRIKAIKMTVSVAVAVVVLGTPTMLWLNGSL